MPPGMPFCMRFIKNCPRPTKIRIGSIQLIRKLISGLACVGMLAVNFTPALSRRSTRESSGQMPVL